MKGSSTGLPLPGSRAAGELATAIVRVWPLGPAAAAVVAAAGAALVAAGVAAEVPALVPGMVVVAAAAVVAAAVVALLAAVVAATAGAVVVAGAGVASLPQAARIRLKINKTGTKMALLCNIAFPP